MEDQPDLGIWESSEQRQRSADSSSLNPTLVDRSLWCRTGIIWIKSEIFM